MEARYQFREIAMHAVYDFLTVVERIEPTDRVSSQKKIIIRTRVRALRVRR
jgi:hypothetical protein